MTDWCSPPKERQTDCFQSFCHSFGSYLSIDCLGGRCFRLFPSVVFHSYRSDCITIFFLSNPCSLMTVWGLCFLSSSIAFSELLWQGTRVRGRRRVPLILPSYPHWGLFYHGKQSSRYTLPLWDARNPPR